MQTDFVYADIDGQLCDVTWDELLAAIERVRAFFAAVKRRFVERDRVIDQIKHALPMREHILINGPSGAAKTMLIRAIFNSIIDARVWAMDMTRFTTNTQVFGGFDVRELRETGRQLHMIEGTAADAHFIQIGEFFDASEVVLRSILGLLNERKIQNGPQVIKPPLLTAFGDTNFSIEMLNAQSQIHLHAVVDRFLFIESVNYVVEASNRRQMLMMSLNSQAVYPLPDLHLHDIVMISGVVRAMNLLVDPYVIDAYEEMTRRFNEKRVAEGGKYVSDRRYVRAAQIMEVSALLQGRQTVTFDDLAMTQFVLAHTDTDLEMLNDLKKEVIQSWVARSARREIESELHRLAEVVKDLPVAANSGIDQMNLAELKVFMVDLTTMQTALQQFETASLEVGQKVIDRAREVLVQQIAVVNRAVDILEAQIPETSTDMTAEVVGPVAKQINNIIDELREVPLLTDELMVRQSEVMTKAMRAKLDVESSIGSIR